MLVLVLLYRVIQVWNFFSIVLLYLISGVHPFLCMCIYKYLYAWTETQTLSMQCFKIISKTLHIRKCVYLTIFMPDYSCGLLVECFYFIFSIHHQLSLQSLPWPTQYRMNSIRLMELILCLFLSIACMYFFSANRLCVSERQKALLTVLPLYP